MQCSSDDEIILCSQTQYTHVHALCDFYIEWGRCYLLYLWLKVKHLKLNSSLAKDIFVMMMPAEGPFVMYIFSCGCVAQ